MICCTMAQHLRLVLVALVAGCVNLTPPTEVTETDGPSGSSDARPPDLSAPDAPQTDTPKSDGPGVDTVEPDVVGPGPDGPAPPDADPPDTPLPPDGPVLLINGAGCSAGPQCESAVCSEGVCCDRLCDQLCRSCKIAGSVGTCTMAAAGVDPRTECPAQAPSTCNRLGGCDGMGACRLHPQGTVCLATRCSAGSETAADTCDGRGACVRGASHSCSPYLCGATTCATSCTGSGTGPCASGNVCVGGTCVTTALAPVLYWSLDDASGTTAVDGSGNSRDGTYTGVTGSPQASTDVPTLMFSNPRSRSFAIANRQGVRLATMSSALRPANNLTVTVWYKATRVDQDNTAPGSDLVSGGDQYMLRLTATDVHLVKRTASGFDKCFGTFANPLDGQWHHVAALTSTSGMKVYVDGVERCSNGLDDSISYTAGDELWVGRHGNGDLDRDFDGQIDDVRVYNRVLTPTEIADIAAGRR
jgi:hypothetical protein